MDQWEILNVMSNFKEIEKVLAHEQKSGCKDSVVIGGLESYINNWAQRPANGTDTAQAQQIIDSLKGYAEADATQRAAMIQASLALMRQAEAASSQVPPTKERPPKPSTPHRSRAQRSAQNHVVAHSPAIVAPGSVDDVGDFEDDEDEESSPALAQVDYGLDASVKNLQGVGAARSGRLAKLGIENIRDLLYHFPRAYRPVKTVSELMFGDDATVIAQVSHINHYKTRNGFQITDVVLMDQTGGITAKFFNNPYLAQNLRPREHIVVSGKVDRDLNRLSFKSPEWERLTKELHRLLNSAHVYPVYPLTEGITAYWLRKIERGVVTYWANKVPDPLPPKIRKDGDFVTIGTALREIHFPSSMETMEQARRRLAFEEFLYIQLGVLRQRQKWRAEPGKALRVAPDLLENFSGGLPYELTGAQKRAIDEVLNDIRSSAPMSRLLQGDVGSGKTVVATVALLVAVMNGSQAALLAPTEILAEQHYKTISNVLEGMGDRFGDTPRVRLLTGSLRPREKAQIHQEIASGEVEIAIGTHALIQETVNFRDLAVAVIDEQHRFGVAQRSALRQKGYNPHILVMSATPIPRTLALTVFGDLDLSILDEMPPGRQEIKTKWLGPSERERAYSFIQKQVKEGRQAFVICPLIEESETIDAKAAVEEYERLRTQIFPDLSVGLIHGKLRAAEKDAVMDEFRDRKIDVLVATSVVEVGIDIPNATVMLIEGADRFGLAQLHQFRGRVGRGEHQSYCLLLADKSGSASDERLKVIEHTQDGFLLAEADLKLRGPGEFFGTRQTGLPDLKVAQLGDVKLLEQARHVATTIFDEDSTLSAPDHQLLKKGMAAFWHGEGDLS